MTETRLDDALRDAGIKDFQYFKSIGSTNDEALAWVDDGAPDFSLVFADEQTKGKGRFDRRWFTPPGSALAFSVILKPTPVEITRLTLFAPLCGLAVHDALAEALSLESEIKWPNDILIQRKKCCGILVEAAWSAEMVNGIVMGIGINISPLSIPPLDAQLFSPTCLELATGEKTNRYLILQQVLQQIRKWRPLLGTQKFFSDWRQHLAFKDEQVMIVQSEKQSIIGIEKGINEIGNLVLVLENQEEVTFEVGDVHLRPIAASSETGGQHA